MHSVRRVRTTAEQREARIKKEAGEISRYQKLQSEVLSCNGNTKYGLEVTATFLAVNPEDYTGWNRRRHLILELDSETKLAQLERELPFLDKLMVRFPKVYWIWNYRLWVLEQFGEAAPYDREMMLVNKLLERDARNFHGWTYRRLIVARLPGSPDEVAKQELDFTTTKINANFSNFSAWHNRTQLIAKLPASDRPPLNQELEYVHAALFMDPEDQSTWIYYRWLLFGSVFCSEAKSHLESELQVIEELSNEEETTWCLYTLWVLYDKARGIKRDDIVQKLVAKDPLRAQRYRELLTQ